MTTENTEKTILENFYSELEPDPEAAKDSFDQLLPVGRDPKAPANDQYLMEFANLEVRKSAADNWPYVSSRLKVVEPEYFENRGFFTSFWLPMVHAEMDEKEIKSAAYNTTGFLQRIDYILGDGIAVSLFGAVQNAEDAEEAMEKLADLLDEERAVVTVKVQKPSKKDKANGYTKDKNAVSAYANAATWEGEDI